MSALTVKSLGQEPYGNLTLFASFIAKAFGGGKYASSPDEASREEQIAVAKKVQAEQGWDAWPTCSKKLGMS